MNFPKDKSPLLNGILVSALTAGLLIALPRSIAGVEFEVAGQISVHLDAPGVPVELKDQQHVFIFRFQDCAWSMRIENLEDISPATAYTEIAHGDGTLYTYEVLNKENVPDTNGQLAGKGKVFSGSVPDYKPFFSQILWFAFAADCALRRDEGLLKELGNKMLSPNQLKLFQHSTEIRWGQSEPRFVEEAIFRSPGFFPTYNEKNEEITIPYPPPFENGFIAAKYTVNGTTNIGGIKIPNSFSMRFFQTKVGAVDATDLKQYREITGKITRVTNRIEGQVFPPAIVGTSWIRDYRIRDAFGNDYTEYWTKDKWHGLHSSEMEKITRSIKTQKQAMDEREKPARRARLIILLLFGFSAIVLLVILWNVRKKPNQTESNQSN